MWAFLNGAIVPERDAVIPVHDRGFLYGDGAFETIRVCRSRAFRLADHLERLAGGAAFLKIKLPFSRSELQRHTADLIARNAFSDAILRITLTRGAGERGYSPRGADHPTLAMTLHPAPPLDAARATEWTVMTASHRVPAGDALAGFKSANKLINILARMEAEEQGANEALLLNTAGEVAEAASANLFWISDGKILTPPVATGILPGVTRSVVLELCRTRRLPAIERATRLAELQNAQAIFLTQSAFGVIAVTRLDGSPVPASPLVAELHRAFCEAMELE